jgi:hypothetical protein
MAPADARTQQGRAVNAAAGLVDLNPELVAVSCERVKDALNLALGAPGSGGRRIHVTIASGGPAGAQPRLISTRYLDGWQHHVTLPTPIEEPVFARALVNVLLLQMVDRAGGAEPGEIPHWLATGLTLEVQAWNPHLLVREGVRGLNLERRMPDPLERARAVLATRPVLSFDELSWPTAAELGGERREAFDQSAHLFVHRLLRLREGATSCRRFLSGLSGRLNWQTAFLQAYSAHFANALAVEKWWAVNVVSFAGRDQWQMWPLDTALARLDEAVRVPARVTTGRDALPGDTMVTLQTVVGQWTGSQQREAVQGAIQKLTRARMAVPPALLSVVDGYLGVLDAVGKRASSPAYGHTIDPLGRISQPLAPGVLGRPGVGPTVVPGIGPMDTRDLVSRLNALDAERASLHALAARATRTSMTP